MLMERLRLSTSLWTDSKRGTPGNFIIGVTDHHQIACVTPIQNAAAILLFSLPCLARATGELPRRDTTGLCHRRDTKGIIRRAGRARRRHSAVNPPRYEFARFRRPHGSAGSAAEGTRANLTPGTVDTMPAVRRFATAAGSDGNNTFLPWTEP